MKYQWKANEVETKARKRTYMYRMIVYYARSFHHDVFACTDKDKLIRFFHECVSVGAFGRVIPDVRYEIVSPVECDNWEYCTDSNTAVWYRSKGQLVNMGY